MDFDLEFECPECGAAIKTTVGAIAQEKTVRCRGGHTVQLRDQGHGARKAKRSLDDLDKSFEDLGKAFRRFGK